MVCNAEKRSATDKLTLNACKVQSCGLYALKDLFDV